MFSNKASIHSNKSLMLKLSEIQGHYNFTDNDMAHRLGCSRQLYQMTRTGKVKLGHKILAGIIKAFPELSWDALYFLSSSADITTQREGITINFRNPFVKYRSSGILKVLHDGFIKLLKRMPKFRGSPNK